VQICTTGGYTCQRTKFELLADACISSSLFFAAYRLRSRQERRSVSADEPAAGRAVRVVKLVQWYPLTREALALSFFRFLHQEEGSIVIDGLDISKISLSTLRSRLTILPQGE
jgi:ABC-type transport system involved in Fe-S cluster assembly fused permease/ATPase subunit